MRRLLILQFGNYGEAERRFAAGGPETFYAQRYTVEYVAGLARAGWSVAVLYLGGDLPRERLPSGVINMGIGLYPPGARPRTREVLERVSSWAPTHLLVATPLPPVIRWAARRRVRVLPLLADSFAAADARSRVRHFELAVTLNLPEVRWVVNHGLNAARDLVRIGVPASKVIAFDWPALVRPEDFAVKDGPRQPPAVRLLYVGQVTEAKGVGDAVRALAQLERGHALTVVGKGDTAPFAALAAQLGVADRVRFAGPMPHDDVLRLMHEHDAVVVPSRPEYPEGLPMTIYEGLCSRTPVLVSDHPMFRGKLSDGENGLCFRAADPSSLAAAVRRLTAEPGLYRRVSVAAEQVCRGFFPGPKWHEVLDHWTAGTPAGDQWLSSRTLAATTGA